MTVETVVLQHPYQPGTLRAALSYRNFRILYIGTSLSSVGTWMQNFTLPAYIDHRTGSASLVGLLLFVQLGPILLLSIPAGIVADRFNRTRLVIAMQVVMLLASASIAILLVLEASIIGIFVAQLGSGIASSIQAPAFSASLPMMVARADLPGAVSLNSAMMNGSRIAGPALAAGLAAAGLSLAGIFVVNSLTFLFLIVPLLFIGLPQPASRVDAPTGLAALSVGLRTARHRKVLTWGLLTMSLFSVLCLPFIGLFPSIARLNFGMDPTGGSYKFLYILFGSGAFFGAIAIGSWLARYDKRSIVRVGLIAFGGVLAVFALASSSVLAYLTAPVLGFVYFAVATALASIFQQNLTHHERGTVMPLWFMSFAGSVPIGNLIAGPFVDRFGAGPVLLFGSLVAIILARAFDLARLSVDDFLAEEEGDDHFVPVGSSLHDQVNPRL